MEKEARLFLEPLYPYITPNKLEIKLIQSKPLRRLKHLAHFGAGSFVSPVVHSRFEHTLGVWKLTALYFPEDIELRVAALLHDIGHLPFSHAVEKTLEFNHHQLTEQYILEDEVSSILEQYNINPNRMIEILNEPSVITGKEGILGIDHLDSFFRDTYMAGMIETLPKHLLHKIRCTPKGIDTDIETGHYLLQLILADHKLFLSPYMVAVDRLLAESIKLHWSVDSVNKSEFARLTDSVVVSMLKTSPSAEAKKLINTLIFEPNKIRINDINSGNGYEISVRKVYSKVPLYQGKPLTEHSNEARNIMKELHDLSFNSEVIIVSE
ncbi:HD domain-containing protein [Halalkalibacter okhensis]|uniref:Metal-dependent phosphohydrolase n=1 Tax=Halalkalibacter okhensis TaxID=333138 RepID=A0A0B0I6W6_9BACI|nr:HD domain-containing protein [Halalkalibacter okhensis]KHF38208.1 metal-dependent phosphohydrolase [Halalkalibacter okhensis]